MSAPAVEMTTKKKEINKELPGFFQDDVVCMVDEDGNELDGYGIILETAWDSDNEDAGEEEEAEVDEEPTAGTEGKPKKKKHTDTDDDDDDDLSDDSEDDDSEDDETEDDEDEDDDDEDDEDDEERLAPGYVRVAWQDRVEEELHHECLRLIDRSFLHGDVVVKRSDPEGQIGTVIEVEVLADITFAATNGGADTINCSKVSTKTLDAPHPYIIGRYVTKGAMLGLVQDCMVEVDVAFGPNVHAPKAVCTLKQPAPSVYKPQLDNSEEVHEDEVGHGVYYPGLKVRAKHASWKRATWIVGKHDSATAAGDEGTVLRVRPTEIHVEWISGDSELVGADGGSEVVLRPDEVTLLGLHEDTRWQVGDHCTFMADAMKDEKAKIIAQHGSGSEEKKDDSASSSSAPPAKGRKGKKAPIRDWNNAFAFCGTITRTYTSIRVQWQDGSIESSLVPAVDYASRKHLLENDFLPEDYAVIAPSCRLVHVIAVDAQERMVKVKYLAKRFRQYEVGEWWAKEEEAEDEFAAEQAAQAAAAARPQPGQDVPRSSPPPSAPEADGSIQLHPILPPSVEAPSVTPVDSAAPVAESADSTSLVFVAPRPPESLDENDSIEEGHEAWVSVFELRANPAMEFCLGGTVIRIPGSRDEQLNASLPPDARLGHPAQVLAIKDGLITVVWADLTESTLEVDQLMIVENEEEEDEDDEDDEEDDEEECEDCGDGEDCEDDCECDCHEIGDYDDEGEDGELVDGEDAAAEEAAAAAESNQVANDAFPSEWVSASYWKKPTADGSGSSSAPPTGVSDAHLEGAAAAFSHMSLASSAVALAAAPVPTVPHVDAGQARPGYSYSSFDIIESSDQPSGPSSAPSSSASSPPAHTYQHKFESTPFAPVNPKAFTKRVREEWKLLRTNLPGGIHVITYESRIDLFKIMMIGNADTPYYLNCFQFDLFLPANYPDEPPSMHFYSRGNRMNPNLYLDGGICLSLLNTWKSNVASQRWDPSNSNLLQLFVSLQGLVIGSTEPYYLEAGYERQLGQKLACLNSHHYNETALVTSLHHLTSYVGAPLQAHPFATIVLEHSLSDVVRQRIFELNRLSVAWEAEKRAQLQAFTGPSSTTAAPDTQTNGSNLDQQALYAVLARFGIRAGGEVHTPTPAAAAASSSPTAAAPATVTYHPSLGFITMLSRQTNALVKAIQRVETINNANAPSTTSSTSASDATQ